MQEYILSLSLGAIHRFMFICFEAFCCHVNRFNVYIIRKSCREGHILRILTLSIELFNYLESTP
jgi:hypothetical protein